MIGFIFQAHNLLPTLTASENVQVAMFGHRPRRERRPRANALLEAARSLRAPTANPDSGTTSG